MNSYIVCIHLLREIYDLIYFTVAICSLFVRSGIPCSHVLKLTDDLCHSMLRIQNWKIYASHYNDNNCELGLEIKKAQMEYQRYKDMGIPVTEELIIKANRPS
jgi:hypothetical protein